MLEMLKTASSSTWISWWGALLSTVLAFNKLYEAWRDRTRVEIDGRFTSSSSVGHEIRIRNLSPRPVILMHWSIYSGSRFWFVFRKKKYIYGSDHDAYEYSIPPFSTYTISLVDEAYFSIDYTGMKSKAVYFKILIAGRRQRLHRLLP